jgi:hypothetical protein
MPVQPDTQIPGLWVNSDWTPQSAGTFAVIIGISSYDYLEGANPGPPARQTYRLGQLPVSAYTAARFFRWLRDDYRVDGCPLAKCWLLLSPTPAELAKYGPLDEPMPARPTIQACERAIREWSAALKEFDDHHLDEAARSRAIFFFSGHGVEVDAEQQLLLPCDWLSPPGNTENDAMSTYNLYAGLRSVPALTQLFLIDACRNTHEELNEVRNLQGRQILNRHPSYRSSRELVGPIIYACPSGAQALSPSSVDEGISYFGTALIEGLSGEQGITLADCDASTCRVKVLNLAGFLDSRVQQLLAATTLKAPVLLTNGRDGVVTEIDAPEPGLLAPATAAPPAPPPLEPKPLPVAGAGDHETFGSEQVTALWTNAEAYRLGTEWQGVQQNPVSVTLEKVARRDTALFRFVFSISEPGTHRLVLRDFTNTYVCILPGDPGAAGPVRPKYVMEVTREKLLGSDANQVTRMDVSLAPENDGALGQAARLWAQYRRVDIPGALTSREMRTTEQSASVLAYEPVESALREKVESPLSATIAGIILLRARRYEQLHNWLRNLANWFPSIPDGPVLWAEQLLQQEQDALGSPEVIEHLLRLNARGLPHTVDAVGYAARQAHELLEFASLSAEHRDKLQRLEERLRAARKYFRPGGLFSVYIYPNPAGPRDDIAGRLFGA